MVLAACAGGPHAIPYNPAIDPADFTNSTAIDNPFFPLVPGTTFYYEGVNEEGTDQTAEIVVTRETRVVMGIECVVVNHLEYVDGLLAEDTKDWFAQDDGGNVWYFGEDVKDYERGQFVGSSGAWEAGVDGALPGIIMPARQIRGEEYRQEYFRGVAEDMGRTDRLDLKIEVKYGSYTDVLRVMEWNPFEPGVTGYAHYARGVGLIYESERGSRERMELVEIRRDQ
jgi:hypothetical protein